MSKRIFLFVIFFSQFAFGQRALDDFIRQAVGNSPTLKEYEHMLAVNQIQGKLNRAENADFHISLTGDYLFTPYFNNQGHILSTDPSPGAVGYDIRLYDGGLYSVQLNLERAIFNSRQLDVLEKQFRIIDDNARYGLELEKHNLQKQVTDQYLNAYQALLMVRLSEEMVSHLEEQAKLAANLVGNGFLNTQDYLLLRIEQKNQAVSLNDARLEYRSNLLQLYALCGMQDTSVADIDSAALHLTEPKEDSHFLVKYTLDSLMTVNQQELFEMKYLPQMNLFFNTGLNAVELKNIQRKFGLSAGLSMSWPIYDGRQKGLTRQQNIINRNTISEYRQFSERTIVLQRKDLLNRIQVLEENIRALADQITDYRQLMLISDKQLQMGNVSMLDHLTLLRRFCDVRKEQIQMEIKYQIEINQFNYWNW